MSSRLFAAAVLLAFSANVSAVLITEVGSYDTLLDQTTLGSSGSGTEEAWIESVLGMDITYTQIDPGSDGSLWEAVTDGASGDYAFDLSGIDPLYFLVKVGGGSGTGTDDTHYLYQNNGSTSWAFLNLSDFGDGVSLENFTVISHLGHTGATTVPEPGSLLLLGTGLLGFAFARRRKPA